jgi:AAA+ ATPase superfamily predicted ATPase
MGPFIFGKTVHSQAYTNREVDAERLKVNLENGVNTIIISPRRWGKSSLVERVAADLVKSNKQHKVIMLDMYAIASETEFLELLAKEVVKSTSNKWQDWIHTVTGFFKKIVPKLSMGVDPQNDFSISFEYNELMKHKAEVLNLAEEVAKENKIKLVICLDEFQNIASWDNYSQIEKTMRAHWQRHKHVTYCLYGSKRHMMADIFNNPNKPFYRFGDIMLLDKIKAESWQSFIENSFTNTGKKITSEAASKIIEYMQCHSWYVQQLAHYTWVITNKVATEKHVEEALEQVLNANMPLYQRETEDLSATQLQLLLAIVNGETQLTAVQTMNKYRIGTPNNILKNKQILMNKDIIDVNDGRYFLLDPAYEMWLRRTFKHVLK